MAKSKRQTRWTNYNTCPECASKQVTTVDSILDKEEYLQTDTLKCSKCSTKWKIKYWVSYEIASVIYNGKQCY